jgi:hypothetical protein
MSKQFFSIRDLGGFWQIPSSRFPPPDSLSRELELREEVYMTSCVDKRRRQGR